MKSATDKTAQKHPEIRKIQRYTMVLCVLWTLLQIGLFGSFVTNTRETIREIGYSMALASFEKDVLFRRWGALHGGVYVPETTRTLANPYLSNIPERDIATPSGRRLTLVNPAYMSRQIFELAQDQPNLPQGHITSLNSIRPENAPDAWETRALKSFQEGAKETVEQMQLNGQPHLRFMRPLMTEKPCLRCHSAQGYKEGDNRGGISVTLSLVPIQNSINKEIQKEALTHSFIWLLGLGCICYGANKITRITKSLRNEHDSLLESEQRFRMLSDTAPVLIWMTDETKGCTYFNKVWCDFVGREHSDLTGKGWAHDVHPDDLEECIRIYENSFDARQPFSMEYRLRRHDGEYRWLMDNGVPRWISETDFVGYIGTCIDITEHKLAEDNLRKLSRAVEQSPISIEITDLNGNIEFVNPKFTQLTGYRAEEVIGQNPRLLKSGKTPPEVYKKLWSTISSGTVWEGEFINKSKNGTHFCVHATISPLRNNKGAVTQYLGIKEDITEKKNVMEQLIQSQKVESIGQLAGGLAHDFNNILSVISGYAYLIKLDMGKDAKQLLNMERILSATAKASELTQSLLAYSRKQVMNPVNQNLNQLITAVGSFITRLIGEHIKFSVTTQGEPLPVCVDSLQIEQVLMNLATNARDAMPNGGTFSITTSAGDIDETYISSLGFGEIGHYAIITVTDTGCGMSPDTVRRIFDPFYTTKEAGKGTGLGMAMVMGIIKQHKGFINVQSEVGVGTEFRIYLPLVVAELLEESKNSDLQIELGEGTILVAEDEPIVREYMERLLTKYGYKVIAAVDGQDAVDKYAAHRDEINLVILDMVMPGKSGKAACDEIKQLDGSVRFMFVSGYAGDIIERQGDLGKNAVLLTKPIQPHVLLSKIAEILKMNSSAGLDQSCQQRQNRRAT